MRPPANTIDQAYFCAKADQAEQDGSGGAVIPAALLGEALDSLDRQGHGNETLMAAACRSLFRSVVRRAVQNGEHAVPLSSTELRALAALVGATIEAELPTDVDNVVIPFPRALPHSPMAEPA